MTNSPPRLEIKNLHLSYDGRPVVNGVSLKIMPGQVMCLLGPSGCGKSTTLRMISGVEMQDSGEIYSDGELVCDTVFRVPPEGRSIGMMFQDFALFPHLSVAKNVGFGLPRGGAENQRRIDQLLDRVGMRHYANDYPHQLSGGEQQRVALARALAPRPKIMLMDEPFSGLDNRLRDGIRDQTLELLKEEGAAVLLVTHEPEEAMRMADVIALMRDGKIVQAAPPHKIYSQPADKKTAAFFSDVNVIRGVVKSGVAQTEFGSFAIENMPDGSKVEVVSRPQHLHIDFYRGGSAPAETKSNGKAVLAHVVRSRFVGNESLVDFKLQESGLTLKACVPSVFLPHAGSQLWLTIPRGKSYVFAA